MGTCEKKNKKEERRAVYESCYVTALFSAWVSSQSHYTLRELLHY